ncbi:hypothetical protein [Thermofilum pendens]|uniref:Uncharacterized protein n=1 Tax=Thermofilum pendens (strain DSM 2475 / Hrk 5) TaxID=368408 RepID=A1S123_THEPD|nr:hypothetical protein [Thermofilum pendens]ABL79153.1 hypothetical protein Tpen_1758 [Thermofilum pendens Hrk 5]
MGFPEAYAVVRLSPEAPRSIKNKVSKTLLGTTVTVKGKRYRGRGLLEKHGGLALCPGTYLVPLTELEAFLGELDSRGLRNYVVVDNLCIYACR